MRLREQIVKDALVKLDWKSLQSHLDQIGFSREQLTELCGHIRRCSDWICKYPRKQFETRRGQFLIQVYDYAFLKFGSEVATEVSREIELLGQIEHG